MSISARNIFEGTVSALTHGAVNAEVSITTAGGDTIVAIVTEASLKALDLATGKPAVALFKAPWVILVADEAPYAFSARNQLAGEVTAITRGAVNAEVSLKLAGGATVHAVVTLDAVSELNLAVGKKATALIKASHIVVGTPRA